FAERGCKRILAVSPANNESSPPTYSMDVIAGNSSAATRISGDGGPSKSAAIRYATGLSVRDGSLYFYDDYRTGIQQLPGYLRKISDVMSQDGTPAPRISSIGGLLHPPALGPAGQGKLLDSRQFVSIGDGRFLSAAGFTGRLLAVDLSPQEVVGVLGYSADLLPSGGDLASFFVYNQPTGIVADPRGRYVYVSDTEGGRLLQLDLTGGTGSILPNDEWKVGELSTPEELLAPMRLSMAENGVLYVADAGAHCIRALTLNEDEPRQVLVMTDTVGQCGVMGISPDGVPREDVRLLAPESVLWSEDGTLYIADSGNHRVLAVRSDGISEWILGNGTESSYGDGVPAREQPVRRPTGLWLDERGNLFVAGGTAIRMVADQDGDGIPEGTDRAWTIYEDNGEDGTPACFEAMTPLPAEFAPDILFASDTCGGSGVFLRRPVLAP
ncbi:MAG: hypothetical protein ACO3JL_20910, partial [Myxococcota bacterium]